jgi:hypothetical protein
MGVCEYALTRARWADRRTACPKRPGGPREQSSRDGLFNRGLGAEVQSVQLSIGWPACLLSGQLGDDWSERVGGDGAEDEVGEADLFPSPLDLLGGCGGVIGKYRQRVRGAKRSGVGVGERHVWRESRVPPV